MSSGSQQVLGTGMAFASAAQAELTASGEYGCPAKMTDRQLELLARWRHYTCETYEGCRIAWDGGKYLKAAEHQMVARQEFLPLGFYDAGGSVPLKFRRPTAPYYLARLVVSRFTSLLFSHRRHPKFVCEGDPATAEWHNAVAKHFQLWHKMIQARNLGGGQGSVAIGFKIVDGNIVFEPHDALWCKPKFVSVNDHELDSIEIRYPFTEQVQGPDGTQVTAWFWYRRVINKELDVTWAKVPAQGDEEPNWSAYRSDPYEHGLGEVPVVWIQNQPVHGEVDGDADMQGTFDLLEAIDRLVAQAIKGTIANADPTVVIKTNKEFEKLTKGSENALDVGPDGDAAYMEMTASGIDAAWAGAEKLKDFALQIARCVVDQSRNETAKTATEIDRDFSSMWEQGDVLRDQYGPHGAVRLMNKVERAVRKFEGTSELDVETGGVTRWIVNIPPKVTTKDGQTISTPQVLGNGGTLSLTWPPYTTPTPTDITQRVEAAAKARLMGLIDRATAIRAVSDIYGVEDVDEMLKRIEAEQRAEADELQMKVESQVRSGTQRLG